MKLTGLLVVCCSLSVSVAYTQQYVQASIGSVNRSSPKFGFNTNAHIPANFPAGSSGANWTQQWFIDSTAYLFPELLRYPGGTNANHWDWQTGWYLPAYQPPAGPSLTIRTDELKPGLIGCNGEGVYVVNMETSTAHYEMDGLRHANAIGLVPKLVELGNEHNLNGGTQFPLQLMSPATYAQLAKIYYDSIKAEFPNAKVCAVGGNTPAILHWVDTVLAYIPPIDAISFHVYLNANNNDLVFHVNRALAVPFGPISNNSSLSYRYNFSGFNTLPPGKEVWVTEFNLLESPSGLPAVISQTWTHVLYNVAMCHFFLTKPNISMILNHSLAGDNHFQAISRYDKKITANALSMKLLYDMSRGSQNCQDIDFSGNPVMLYGTTSIPKLIGWKFSHPGTEKGFICNFSRDTFAISLSSVFTNPMHVEQYSADTALTVNGISSLNKYSSITTDTVLVYPFSITQITSALPAGNPETVAVSNELWLYPNPAKNMITLKATIDLQDADLYIYDLSGKAIIHRKDIKGHSCSIAIDELSSGLYTLKIENRNKVITGKFMVD